MQSTGTELEHHYIHVNNIRMHYVKAGRGERLIVLLHGFPEFWYSWRKQIGPLSEHFTVVAPDMRGYNLTDKPKWGYETDVLVHDLISLIRELGYEKAIVVGHDWGGVIAWAAAIAFPHRVERLIVMNAPHPSVLEEALRSGNWRQFLRSQYVLFFQLPWLPEAIIRADDYAVIEQAFRRSAIDPSAFTDKDIDDYKTALARPGALTAALNYYRAALRQGSRGLFASTGTVVRVPTLLIWGQEDAALGTELTYNNERFVPDLTVKRIPNCSHWVQQDCPDLVNQYILEFLQDVT